MRLHGKAIMMVMAIVYDEDDNEDDDEGDNDGDDDDGGDSPDNRLFFEGGEKATGLCFYNIQIYSFSKEKIVMELIVNPLWKFSEGVNTYIPIYPRLLQVVHISTS